MTIDKLLAEIDECRGGFPLPDVSGPGCIHRLVAAIRSIVDDLRACRDYHAKPHAYASIEKAAAILSGEKPPQEGGGAS